MRAPCAPILCTVPTLGYAVGSGTVVVLGRRGYGAIVRSPPGWIRTIRSLLVEWHNFRGTVGRIDDLLPCPTSVGT